MVNGQLLRDLRDNGCSRKGSDQGNVILDVLNDVCKGWKENDSAVTLVGSSPKGESQPNGIAGRAVQRGTLKFLCSMCARGHTGPEPYCLAMIDMKRAYFHALAQRSIIIATPKEDLKPGDEGCVRQLQLTLCGTRDAGQKLCA